MGFGISGLGFRGLGFEFGLQDNDLEDVVSWARGALANWVVVHSNLPVVVDCLETLQDVRANVSIAD